MTYKDPLRRTTTLVVCPHCKGHGVIYDSPVNTQFCDWCDGARVLEEVVELRRVEK